MRPFHFSGRWPGALPGGLKHSSNFKPISPWRGQQRHSTEVLRPARTVPVSYRADACDEYVGRVPSPALAVRNTTQIGLHSSIGILEDIHEPCGKDAAPISKLLDQVNGPPPQPFLLVRAEMPNQTRERRVLFSSSTTRESMALTSPARAAHTQRCFHGKRTQRRLAEASPGNNHGPGLCCGLLGV